jgi:hypothetical protein
MMRTLRTGRRRGGGRLFRLGFAAEGGGCLVFFVQLVAGSYAVLVAQGLEVVEDEREVHVQVGGDPGFGPAVEQAG